MVFGTARRSGCHRPLVGGLKCKLNMLGRVWLLLENNLVFRGKVELFTQSTGVTDNTHSGKFSEFLVS